MDYQKFSSFHFKLTKLGYSLKKGVPIEKNVMYKYDSSIFILKFWHVLQSKFLWKNPISV